MQIIQYNSVRVIQPTPYLPVIEEAFIEKDHLIKGMKLAAGK